MCGKREMHKELQRRARGDADQNMSRQPACSPTKPDKVLLKRIPDRTPAITAADRRAAFFRRGKRCRQRDDLLGDSSAGADGK